MCGATPPSDPLLADREHAFAEALGSQFGGEAEQFNRQVAFDIHMDHPFNELIADTCRGNGGYGFRPERGSAVMFDSMKPGTSTPVLGTWHAGCNVVKGTKIILQKFKVRRAQYDGVCAREIAAG